MLAILDSLFLKVVNTTSSPIGVEGGGMVGSYKVAGPSNIKTFLWPNGFNSGCFQLHMLQNVATLMPCRISQSCGDARHLLAVCLAVEVGTIYRPPEHPWMPDRPLNEASVKADLEALAMV